MSKQELIKLVLDVFKVKGAPDAVYVTSDGMAFVKQGGEEDMGLHQANTHARTLSDKDVVEITKEEALGKSKQPSDKDRIAAIKACKSADELTGLEIGNDESDAVKAAFDEAMKKLSK